MISGAGFNGLSSNWDNQAIVQGAIFGGFAGCIGGLTGAAIGGGWGAMAGGASANFTHQLLYNGGNLHNINWSSVGLSGLTSFGLYHGLSFASWKWGGGEHVGGSNITYRQFCKINTAYQRSRFWHREYGVILNTNGRASMVRGNKLNVSMSINKKAGDYATAIHIGLNQESNG